jgi:acyl dehydratase
VRFTKQTWPGDELTTRVEVTEKRDAEGVVVLECELLNGKGEAVVSGTATAALPSRP